MKVCSRRAAAVVLAASLALSASAIAAPTARGSRERDVPKILKLVKKIIGIVTHDDLPLPPPPKPS